MSHDLTRKFAEKIVALPDTANVDITWNSGGRGGTSLTGIKELQNICADWLNMQSVRDSEDAFRERFRRFGNDTLGPITPTGQLLPISYDGKHCPKP